MGRELVVYCPKNTSLREYRVVFEKIMKFIEISKFDAKEKSTKILVKKGDFISTPPYEIHALKIGEDGNEFIVFSEGKRGGKDYESDTFRVKNIIEDEL